MRRNAGASRQSPRTAKIFHGTYRGVIQQGDAIPKLRCPPGCGPTGRAADSELWHGADADEIRLLLAEFVVVLSHQLIHRRPLLATPADVLARIETDGTIVRRRCALRVLDSASAADPDRHARRCYRGSANNPGALVSAALSALLSGRTKRHAVGTTPVPVDGHLLMNAARSFLIRELVVDGCVMPYSMCKRSHLALE